MTKRRDLLKGLMTLPLLGSLTGQEALAASANPAGDSKRDFFKELGVRTFINAAGFQIVCNRALQFTRAFIRPGAPH